MRTLIIQAAAALVLLSGFPIAQSKGMPTVQQADLVSRFGAPDQVRSTENDKPRPPFLTRMLEYRKQGVRIVLLANAPIGSPPPYSSWKLMGYQNIKDNAVITEEEFARRVATRTK
jgi:hypothetical protein